MNKVIKLTLISICALSILTVLYGCALFDEKVNVNLNENQSISDESCGKDITYDVSDSQIVTDINESESDNMIDCEEDQVVDFTSWDEFSNYVTHSEIQEMNFYVTETAINGVKDILPTDEVEYIVIIRDNYFLISYSSPKMLEGLRISVSMLDDKSVDIKDIYKRLGREYYDSAELSMLKGMSEETSGGFVIKCGDREMMFSIYKGEIKACSFVADRYMVQISNLDVPGSESQKALVDALLSEKKISDKIDQIEDMFKAEYQQNQEIRH